MPLHPAPLADWPFRKGPFFLVAGPCAAESREQVMATAHALKGLPVSLFRAGIWKPRTRPNSFEGMGVAALAWLQEMKQHCGLPYCVEVANSEHVEAALKYGADALWIGARTTVNPFTVQEIADALAGIDIPVLIKNPVNPDVDLWTGAMERFLQSGKTRVMAIHRGFSTYHQTIYRNRPMWEIPLELKRRMPGLPLLCDPSHISGKRSLLQEVSQKALDLNFDGLMIETHPNPEEARSDREQQLTPVALHKLLDNLLLRKSGTEDPLLLSSLEELRKEVDRLDDAILQTIAERMELSEEIGKFKQENGLAIYQPERYNEILTRMMGQALAQNLSADLIARIWELIHKESIRHQRLVMRGKNQ